LLAPHGTKIADSHLAERRALYSELARVLRRFTMPSRP
jgi:hypothetical protein